MSFLITQNLTYQTYVFNFNNKNSKSYEHKKFIIKIEKILNKLNDFEKITNMLIAKSIIMKSGNNYNDYNF